MLSVTQLNKRRKYDSMALNALKDVNMAVFDVRHTQMDQDH